jgi:hypothetical protein
MRKTKGIRISETENLFVCGTGNVPVGELTMTGGHFEV